ncbi:MAG: dihydrodipicolinate synthase family protein [bacterium]|nr:dihydrodipicolinate synthase family protein [bacterium]
MDKKQHKEVFSTPVFPIPPAFTDAYQDEDGTTHGNELDLANIARYVQYLDLKRAEVAMTTAGTSAYNLLNFSEILQFNRIVLENFSKTVVVGVPAYDTRTAKRFVEEFEKIAGDNIDRVYYMWLYPERYYNDDIVRDYFFELASHCNRPCLFHGKPMKHAKHGYSVDFEAELVNSIASHPNIVGMKEESSHMAKATQVIAKIDTEEFAVIVAGGSMSRFEMQQENGACSFLTGLGSLFPEYALNYYDFKQKGLDVRPFTNREDEAFETMMDMGWHLGLRTALQEMGFQEPYTRQPFPLATDEQREQVSEFVKSMSSRLSIPT